MSIACVYCLENNELKAEQVLFRGRDFYLCAPRGQLVEGYLVIAPYRCIGSLATVPRAWFAELVRLKALVASFYGEAYGALHWIVYEQGRAGGGAPSDAAAGFPLHAHLCFLPLSVDVRDMLTAKFVERRLNELEDIPEAARDNPYVYVENARGRYIYLPASPETYQELERMRMKPEIAARVGLPERGQWRSYPGDRELHQLIRRFSAFLSDRAPS